MFPEAALWLETHLACSLLCLVSGSTPSSLLVLPNLNCDVLSSTFFIPNSAIENLNPGLDCNHFSAYAASHSTISIGSPASCYATYKPVGVRQPGR